jgi:hypothetical protein
MMTNKYLKAVGLCSSAILSGVTAQAQADWDFLVEPYVLVTSIDGDADIGRIEGADLAVDFGTILDNLEMAGMVHAEALHSSGWGLAFDWGMMDLGADSKTNRGGVVDASVRQAVTELQLFRRFVADNGGSVDIIGGLRNWDNELQVKLDRSSPLFQTSIPTKIRLENNPDWTDYYLGVRTIQPLAENWHWMAYVDVGAGDADFTSSVKGGVQYAFNDTWSVELLYKATWVDYDDGRKGADHFAYDTVTHGPLVGLMINF